MFTLSTASAQYASGKMVPDSTQAINADTSQLLVRIANSINTEDMRAHLTILASDEFGGRETGHPGNDLAAEYIKNHFQELNMPEVGDNGYFQDVAFTFTKWEENKIMIDGKEYAGARDFIAFPDKTGDLQLEADEVLFLGFGIDDPRYSDYRKEKVKDKVILINKGEPMKRDSATYWISGTDQPSEWSDNIEMKLKAAKKNGVKMVLIIEDEFLKMVNDNRRKLLGPTVTLSNGLADNDSLANHVYISTTMARDLMAKKAKKVIKSRKYTEKKGRNCSTKIKNKISVQQKRNSNVLLGRNVLGYIQGTDLKDELVVVSAHYDHIGQKGDVIYNGADDNGSGTTTLLEVAEAFTLAAAEGQRPRRSVLFMLFTGEEKGLLGSYYYTENPTFPLENTVANVNIDMVGRLDKTYENITPNYVYVIGSDRLSTDLHRINEELNQEYSQLLLDYKYNDEKDPNRFYFRSDHYNFAKNGIPSIFFFNGVHDDYHQPGDTVDKIHFEKMELIGRHIFHLTWDIANRAERLKVDGEVK